MTRDQLNKTTYDIQALDLIDLKYYFKINISPLRMTVRFVEIKI